MEEVDHVITELFVDDYFGGDNFHVLNQLGESPARQPVEQPAHRFLYREVPSKACVVVVPISGFGEDDLHLSFFFTRMIIDLSIRNEGCGVELPRGRRQPKT